MLTAPRFVLVALVIGLVASAHAQTGAPLKAASDDTSRSASAAIDRPSEAVIETQLRIAERPDTAGRIATYKRNLYEALLKKGFTGDQAISITIATPLPSVYPAR